MYSLHVTVTREFDVPEPDTVDTVVGVDINERNVALTALDRETMQTKGTLAPRLRTTQTGTPMLPHYYHSLSGTR
jgi:transposase